MLNFADTFLNTDKTHYKLYYPANKAIPPPTMYNVHFGNNNPLRNSNISEQQQLNCFTVRELNNTSS